MITELKKGGLNGMIRIPVREKWEMIKTNLPESWIKLTHLAEGTKIMKRLSEDFCRRRSVLTETSIGQGSGHSKVQRALG